MKIRLIRVIRVPKNDDDKKTIQTSSLINEDLAPIPPEKRKWGTWNYAAFGSA